MSKKRITSIIMLAVLAIGIACVVYGVTGTGIYENAASMMGSDRIRDVSMGRTSQWLLEKLNGTKPQFMVVIANMVPAIPNGVIPFIAAKTDITAKEYVTAVAMGSWLQILTSCMAGQFIIQGKWMFTGIAIAFQCLVIVIILLKRDWFISRID